MFLTVDAVGHFGNREKIDLTSLVEDSEYALDDESFKTILIIAIAQQAIEWGVSFDDMIPLEIYDQEVWESTSSESISVDFSRDWIGEISKLTWFVEYGDKFGMDRDQVFAVLNDTHWMYVDFDDLSSAVEDDYHGEYEGDAEEFAREWMSNFDEGDLPEHLQSHFDYESYGEALLEDFSKLRWNDRTFLYNQ